jgi:hypothetical protein
MIESDIGTETVVATGRDQHGTRWIIIRYTYDTLTEHYIDIGAGTSFSRQSIALDDALLAILKSL